MVQLSDEQVEIIRQRINNDGVTDTGLQNDLLDHYCCFIEENMEHEDDFERAYNKAFRAITPNGMHEIEEELFIVLTFKNHTNMKRAILITGALVTLLVTCGIIFKYMFAPGASALIASGITLAALLFIPLVFVLRARETQLLADKVKWAIGSLFAMTIAFSVLFKVQHWPGANILGMSAVFILLAIFLPVYFFTGLPNRLTRINTVVTSVFIVIGSGLYFTLLMTPRTERMVDARETRNYLRNEQLLRNEQKSAEQLQKGKSDNNGAFLLGRALYNKCEELKTYLVKTATGADVIGEDFEAKEQDLVLGNGSAADYFRNFSHIGAKRKEIVTVTAQYNSALSQSAEKLSPIPVTANVLDDNAMRAHYNVSNALNDLVQIQMILLQNEKGIAAL